MKYLPLLFLVIAIPVDSSIRPYEPKPVRVACNQNTYNMVCVPRVKQAEVNNKVNWI